MSWNRRINLSNDVYLRMENKKKNIEKIIKKDLSFNDFLKILMEDEKKIIIVPKRKRRRALIQEMYPIIDL